MNELFIDSMSRQPSRAARTWLALNSMIWQIGDGGRGGMRDSMFIRPRDYTGYPLVVHPHETLRAIIDQCDRQNLWGVDA